MNLLGKKWINKGKLDILYYDDKIVIENKSNSHKFLIYPHIFSGNKSKQIYLNMEGISVYGTGPTLKVLNRHRTIMGQCGLNSRFANEYDKLKYYIISLYVPAGCKVEITKIEHLNNVSNEIFDDYFNNDTLLITPGYPSLENKYNTAFVHTRVQEYNKAGINLDIAVVNGIPEMRLYEFEGIHVFKCDYFKLREILRKKKYKRILIHFFEDNYGNILDNIDLTETQLFLYLHGADVLYRDYPKYASHYFEEDIDTTYLREMFERRDFYFKKYNNYPNVTWMFVSEFVKNRAEELLDIKFNNYEIIPAVIDTDLFKYEKKNPELRKKIFVLRRFTNDRCYALDIDVRVILELSRRPFFNDLEFDLYGDGEMFDILTAPIKDFKNVNLHREFLTHEDIRNVQKNHGIGLFASRFDTQGVSIGEAAASGCAVVTSKVPAIMGYIDSELGVTCEIENFREYADVIEKMYYDENYFQEVAKRQSEAIYKNFSYDSTVKKEIEIFQNNDKKEYKLSYKEPVDNPILTIVVPAYNVEPYLHHGVMSLLNQPYAHKLEILIVNDGSKDKTVQIAEELQNKTTVNGKSIVRLINKENGGHGPTINRGIREARGKYLKVMDGDDTVDSVAFYELLKILENENTDIILNNYIEDWAPENRINIKRIYPFMVEGLEYNFDDLCYEGYGFDLWGPILSCSTYKTDMLKKADFMLSEKCFYVDMELNTHIAIACKTIKYYSLDIYRYLLGRKNQSVTKASYMRNYRNHERVIMNIINILNDNLDKISECKKSYIKRKLILTMIKSQYIVTVQFFNKGKPFREFEKKLKKYPEYYNNPEVATRGIKFHRWTHGYFIRFHSILLRILSILKK